uniref:Reverse transcriptase domain-containing protein n=1 Tax=Fagus sylvatica TaxID=28930 RepID=A0A2N9GEF8_FAGSY
MAGETSGPGPSEQEIRMVALERKFDELLSFVQLIAKRNTDDENQRKEDDKDTSEGRTRRAFQHQRHSTKAADATKARRGKTPNWTARLIVWRRRSGSYRMAPYADNEPLLIPDISRYPDRECSRMVLTVEEDLSLEGAGRYLPGSIWVQLPNSSGSDLICRGWRRRVMKPSGNALKTKKIVDMTALMALAEQAAKKAPTKRKEGDVQMIGRNNGRPRQVLPTFTMQPIQPRPIQAPAPTQVPAPAPTPSGCRQGRPYNGPQRRDFNPNSTCDFHFGEVGHTVENCGQLKHRVQDLIDHGVLKFEGLPNITTNPLPNHPEGGVNMVEIEEGNEERIAWRRLFYTLEKKRHITPLEAPPGPSTGDACEYHSGARGHSLECCEEFKKKVTDLMEERASGERRNTIGKKPMKKPDWGYFMEDDTDEWRDVDFTEFFQFPCLIVPPGFVTPEFEIFYEDGDPEVHLQKYGEKMALHLENELLMISVFPESLSKQAAAWFYQLRNLTGWDDLVRVFLERYRFNPHSILEYLGLKKDEEPYIIPDPGVSEGRRRREEPMPSHHHPNLITTTTAEEEYAGPMVEGLSIHTITWRGGFHHHTTDPPLPTGRRSQDVDLACHCYSVSQVVMSKRSREKSRLEPAAPQSKRKALIALLREFHEIFAWSYQDMPGLDTDIVVHKIPLKPECKPVKASTAPNEARTNIVPVPKKDGKVQNQRMSYSHSWTDSQGTIRSKMAEEDKSKTAFVTHWGTFVYDVMPFGLKNAGATYQRAMVTLFHDMIHHEIEVYVDDMIAKSRTAQDHLTDLRKLFQRLKKYQLRLNPNKCAFGVTSGKVIRLHPYGDLRASVQAVEKRCEDKDVPSFYTSQSKKHPWAACWDNKTRLGRRSRQSTILARSSRSRRPATCWLRRRAAHWLGPPRS